MAATINNRIHFPTNVVPLQLISGSTQAGHVGCGIVTYTVASSAGSTLAAGQFGLTQVYAAVRVDAAGSSAAHTAAGVATGATNGAGFIIAIGPID